MTQAHALAGQLALVLAVIAAVWSIALAVTRRPVGPLYLGSLVWLGIAVVIAAILGSTAAVTAGPPSDALHVVYGLLALAMLPGAALVAAGRPTDQRPIVAAIATTVLVILLLRLIQTGS